MKFEKTALRLREALSNKNMRPQDLANASGVNKASISQYLNGSHAPSNISSGKMAKVLDVPAPWLMGFDIPISGHYELNTEDGLNVVAEFSEKYGPDPKIREALEMYEKYLQLPPKAQGRIDGLLESAELKE